jgi:GT2 family glycosyltransferase
MSQQFDEIGAVVIGRNEGQRLIGCLKSLKTECDRIVYVDSGSTDGSAEAAKQLGVSVVCLDMALPFTAARARNAGFAALTARWPVISYVQFIDGDCDLVAGWLNVAVVFLRERPGVALACGRRHEREPQKSCYTQMSDMEWDTPVGEASECGGDALIRVAAFEAVGGFQERLIAAEEPELCVRLRESGWKIWRLDVDMTRHDIGMTRFSQWWLRCVRSGYGCTEVAWLHWNSRFAVFKRETLSALFWSGVLPVAIVGGALIHPVAAAAVLIYPLQISRMAIRRGATASASWVSGFFTMANRFAVFQGILTLLWSRWRHKPAELIEYK